LGNKYQLKRSGLLPLLFKERERERERETEQNKACRRSMKFKGILNYFSFSKWNTLDEYKRMMMNINTC
jgi:hypothetical protein